MSYCVSVTEHTTAKSYLYLFSVNLANSFIMQTLNTREIRQNFYCALKMFVYLCRPENVPRLYDLVKVKDEKVKTAFYFALRDTLVGKDLEQATRISDKVFFIFLLILNFKFSNFFSK
jgi:chromosome segregation ATPase